MIGKRVLILMGNHCGKVGEVVNSSSFPGVPGLVYVVYLKNAETALCSRKEMKVIESSEKPQKLHHGKM